MIAHVFINRRPDEADFVKPKNIPAFCPNTALLPYILIVLQSRNVECVWFLKTKAGKFVGFLFFRFFANMAGQELSSLPLLLQEEIYLSRVGELDKVTSERDGKRQEHEALRKKRLEEFMAGFSIITTKLKEMYQV